MTSHCLGVSLVLIILQNAFGRAECLFDKGDYAEAMGLYGRVWGVSVDRGDDHYWQSQLRMLQILSRTNRHTSRIGPQIQRLRQKDPQLGGERFKREFELLQGRDSRTTP